MLAAIAISPMVAGIEPSFLQWAVESGKQIEYLESPSSFAALADEIPVPLVESTLSAMLADVESARANLVAMHAAWLASDMNALARISQRLPLLALPLVKNAILDRRNEAWAPKLKIFEQTTKKTLVAVGALHLCVQPTAQEIARVQLQPAY